MSRYNVDDDEVNDNTHRALASLQLSQDVRANVMNLVSRVSFGINPDEHEQAFTEEPKGAHDWRRYIVARIMQDRKILASVTLSAGNRHQFLCFHETVGYAEKAACIILLASMQEGMGLPMGFKQDVGGVIEAPETWGIVSTDYVEQKPPMFYLSSRRDVFFYEIPYGEL